MTVSLHRTTHIGASEVKAHFADIISRVAYGNERFIVERHGKPVVAIVSLGELVDFTPSEDKPGFLSFQGIWGDLLSDEEIDDFVAAVYRLREEPATPVEPLNLG